MDAQRLDLWLWCARLHRHRADCARFVEAGNVRINRVATDKAHARVRPGDVLTLAVGQGERGSIRIWRILGLAARRGPPEAARALYEELTAGQP
ncbi:MAG: S4 domain-containing protein [Pseudomonadota bacterium]